MNWITESLLMFVCSAILYLSVRKASLLQIPTEISNLAMFFIPMLGFIKLSIYSKEHIHFTFWLFIGLLLASVLFSYLGNIFSLKSIEQAANPGYSLIISKSYVIFTTSVAILFFHSTINLQRILGILLIIFFSGCILIQKNTKANAQKSWLAYAFGAFFCWGLLSLSAKYFYTQDISPLTFLSFISLVASLCIFLQIKRQRIAMHSIKKYPFLFIIIGLSALGFNFFQFDAIKTAPNLGYVNAINASSISLVTIFSIFLFKDEFSLRKFIGIIGVTLGLIVLLI